MWVRATAHTISNMESGFHFYVPYYLTNSLLLSKIKCYKFLINPAWILGEKTILRGLEVSLLGSLLFQFQMKYNFKVKLYFSFEYFFLIIFLM